MSAGAGQSTYTRTGSLAVRWLVVCKCVGFGVLLGCLMGGFQQPALIALGGFLLGWGEVLAYWYDLREEVIELLLERDVEHADR